MSTPSENQELGERIAKARVSKQMTLRQLAGKVNLSSSPLSQIEKGHINPSLATLRTIALALNVPLGANEIAPAFSVI